MTAPERNAVDALRRLWILRASELDATAERMKSLAIQERVLGAAEAYRECVSMLDARFGLPRCVPCGQPLTDVGRGDFELVCGNCGHDNGVDLARSQKDGGA